MAENNVPKAKRPRIKVRQQESADRIKNFNEVPFGYNEEEAIEEANRCLQCKNPTCISGCPVNINIKEFIRQITIKDFKGAIDTIKLDSSLPAVCGRVCPQEEQCEHACVMLKTKNPINIGALERFAADWETQNTKPVPASINKIKDKDGNPIKIAIAGAGPAGLTVAGDLAKMGYSPVVFEAMHLAGGVLIYGIPEFRLPKAIVQGEVDYLKSLGVEFKLNVVVGKSYTVEDVFKLGYKALFVGVGAGTPMFLGIPGEQAKGVYSANEFLTRINAMKAYRFPEYDTPVKLGKKVAVVGAGNVAMDAARWSLRLPGVEEVYIVYRRSEDEMPARIEEKERAKEEGIIFKLLTNPIAVMENEQGWVKSLKCIKMELGEPDESGRRKPVAVAGSDFEIEVDTVISALGTKANKLMTSDIAGLKLNKWGYIEADPETGATSLPGIFAGGDISTGSSTVIAAMGAGKKAAKGIDAFIKETVLKN
ncbi:MAG: glutamate synthase (NADPH), homotetrameric [Candidatus Goldiibacteriota bacterium HGW-Goldbacteria-1]|nr:MAG: glutamate synthase (NADPH), homotetrameric [Candidatus Goldiibacteriota bacterium HGW-Goldbacteria-1]